MLAARPIDGDAVSRRKYVKLQVALTAAAVALTATSASANEGRFETRAGVVWAGGEEEFVAGIAAGYDFDLGEKLFLGAEASGDKIFVDGADVVWGTTARVGTKIGEGKLFATGGYSFAEGEDMPHVGAGYEHKITDTAYLKTEYRHFFSDFADANTVVAGIGINF